MFIKKSKPIENINVIRFEKFDMRKESKLANNLSNVSNTSLKLNKDKHSPPPSSHTPLKGMRKWFTSYLSCLSRTNSHRMVCKKTDGQDDHYINKADGHTVEVHADRLIESIPDHGDALVMNFGRGLHSAILLRDGDTLKYFSLYGDKSKECTSLENCRTELIEDMKNFNDTLFTGDNKGKSIHQATSSKKNNFQKVKLSNVSKAINAWKENSIKFKTFTNNCSYPIAKMLEKGSPENITFKHQRKNQMPYNTFNMARELANIQQGNVKPK